MKSVKLLLVSSCIVFVSSCVPEANYDCRCYATLSPNNGGGTSVHADTEEYMAVNSKADAQNKCDTFKATVVRKYDEVTDSTASVSCDLIKK